MADCDTFQHCVDGVQDMHCKCRGSSKSRALLKASVAKYFSGKPALLAIGGTSFAADAKSPRITGSLSSTADSSPYGPIRPSQDSMFDTLLHCETERIRSHLAHHYEFRGDQLWLRLQSDVYFHHGEKMTSAHVADCLHDRVTQPHLYQAMYRHIADVDTEGE